MDRLTVRRSDGRFAIANKDGATPTEQVLKIPMVINRLAAYEDTGLEPEEITALIGNDHVTICSTSISSLALLTTSVSWPRLTGRGGAWCCLMRSTQIQVVKQHCVGQCISAGYKIIR